MRRKAIILITIFLVTGCVSGGFDSAKKTSQLRQGMRYQEVVSLLGEPSESEMKGGRLVTTFWLHQSWRGNVPYDLVFDPKKRTLISWGENENKFQASQKQLGQFAAALSQPAESAPGQASSGGAVPSPGPNNATLQRQIAGIWWGYSGSTERKIGLCPDGTYRDYTESSYSGQSYNQYGDQTMAWGSASQSGGSGRWTITGTTQSGTIHVVYSDGNSRNISYRQINDPGCLSFDGNTLCRSQTGCQ